MDIVTCSGSLAWTGGNRVFVFMFSGPFLLCGLRKDLVFSETAGAVRTMGWNDGTGVGLID